MIVTPAPNYNAIEREPLVVDRLKRRIARPLRKGAQLLRMFSLLVRVELAEVDMAARECKPALSVRDDAMLSLVSDYKSRLR